MALMGEWTTQKSKEPYCLPNTAWHLEGETIILEAHKFHVESGDSEILKRHIGQQYKLADQLARFFQICSERWGDKPSTERGENGYPNIVSRFAEIYLNKRIQIRFWIAFPIYGYTDIGISKTEIYPNKRIQIWFCIAFPTICK